MHVPTTTSFRRFLGGTALILAGSLACSEEQQTQPPPVNRFYDIVYQANATGNGRWDMIQFDNGLGNLRDVPLPVPKAWTTSISMDPGNTVQLLAQGAVDAGGTLTITVTGSDLSGNMVSHDSVIVGVGALTTYTLSIPSTGPATLP